MKQALLFLFVGFIISTATVFPQSKICFSAKGIPVRDVLRIMEEQSDYNFFCNSDLPLLNEVKTIIAQNNTVEELLDKIIAGAPYRYTIFDKMVVISELESLFPSIVSGKVQDKSTGEPLVGVNIIVEGTTIGTITDKDGHFSIRIPAPETILVCSYIGYNTFNVRVDNLSFLDIQLTTNIDLLEEVIVIGFGVQKKITLTGAVSTVKSDELIKTPVANISSMLTGRSPGLLTVQRTGEPGEDITILRIRGSGTFSGSNAPLIMIDGIEATNYNSIDPNEIENITILKDASATAVYGVRGANGVILITTKRGRIGKPKISLSTNFAVNSIDELMNSMRAYDYVTGYELAKQYDSYVTGVYVRQFTEEDFQLFKDKSDPIFHPDTHWPDQIFKEVTTQHQHNLNIRGGTEKTKYFISAGVFHQGGLFNNTNMNPGFFDIQTNYNRYNFRSNFDFGFTKRLTLKVNIANQVEEKRGVNNDDISTMLRVMWEPNPVAHPAPVDGKVIVVKNPLLGINNNAVQSFYNHGYMKRYRNHLNSAVRLNYDLDFITKGLSVHGMVSYQNFNQHKLSYNKDLVTYTPIRDLNDSIVFVPNGDESPYTSSQSTDKNRRTYVEAGINYARNFGKHTITALLIYNQSKLHDPDLQYFIPRGYQGTAGRVTYNYKSRYLAEFNMGHNGTENFAPGKRFGFFPAFSAGWVLTEEPFFPENKWISFVKFKASYGEVGNDLIGGNRFLYSPSSYGYRDGSYYFGLVGISANSYEGAYEGKIGNPDVTWERARKTDIGIELNLLEDKIRISADYFAERRNNILTTRNTLPVIPGIGDNYPTMNIGIMENRGYDGELGVYLKTGFLQYFAILNYTYAHNTIVFQDEIPNPYAYQYRTGQRQGEICGPVEVDGLYNTWMEVNDAYRPLDTYQNNRIQPGDIRWKDINGDGKFDDNDQGPIGYSNFPEKSLGIALGASYKGFDFSALIQGSFNVSFVARLQYMEGWRNSHSQTSANLLTSWSQERYEAGLPIYFPHYNIQATTTKVNGLLGTYFLEDQSYIRLRSVEAGYTFNENKLFSIIGISSARVYISGANLFTRAKGLKKRFKGVNPETITSFGEFPYPKTITFSMGANISL